jgi:hypothetical protein
MIPDEGPILFAENGPFFDLTFHRGEDNARCVGEAGSL